MERIDYRRDKSKPMPKKKKATEKTLPGELVPGRIINIYDVETKSFIGPGVVARPADGSGSIEVICFPAVDWRCFDDEIVETKVKQCGAVCHIETAVDGDWWAWAWPNEWMRFAEKGWR